MYTNKILDYLIILDAVAHVWLAIAAMAFWKKSVASELFDFNESLAEATAPMAKLLGAMYLVFAFCFMYCHVGDGIPLAMKAVLLLCQVIAGSVGGYFISRKIFFLQGIPGIIGLVVVFMMAEPLFG